MADQEVTTPAQAVQAVFSPGEAEDIVLPVFYPITAFADLLEGVGLGEDIKDAHAHKVGVVLQCLAEKVKDELIQELSTPQKPSIFQEVAHA